MFDKTKYKLNDSDDVFIDINKIKDTAKDPNKCSYYTIGAGSELIARVDKNIIPAEYAYRPDLIAWFLYRDVSMADYIAIINDIDDSPEGFYIGRRLKVLNGDYIGII